MGDSGTAGDSDLGLGVGGDPIHVGDKMSGRNPPIVNYYAQWIGVDI